MQGRFKKQQPTIKKEPKPPKAFAQISGALALVAGLAATVIKVRSIKPGAFLMALGMAALKAKIAEERANYAKERARNRKKKDVAPEETNSSLEDLRDFATDTLAMYVATRALINQFKQTKAAVKQASK